MQRWGGYLRAEPGKIDSERSKPERDQRHGSETETVRSGIQIQSGDGKLPTRNDAGRGVPEIWRLLFHAQPMETSLPTTRSRGLRRPTRLAESTQSARI